MGLHILYKYVMVRLDVHHSNQQKPRIFYTFHSVSITHVTGMNSKNQNWLIEPFDK